MNRIAELTCGDRGRLAGRAPVLFALCPVSPEREDPRGDIYCGDGEAFLSLCRGLGVACDVAACNRAIEQWPGALTHAVSLHGDLIAGQYMRARREAGHPCDGVLTHGTTHQPGLDFVWRFYRSVPSSGALMCLLGGLEQCMGYGLVATNARLVGPSHEHYLHPWKDCKRKGLMGNVCVFTPMSGPGLLNALLGPATPEKILAAARLDTGDAA